VAALVVIWYHVFEGFATSPLDQHFNHGYLAVGRSSICRKYFPCMGDVESVRWASAEVAKPEVII